MSINSYGSSPVSKLPGGSTLVFSQFFSIESSSALSRQYTKAVTLEPGKYVFYVKQAAGASSATIALNMSSSFAAVEYSTTAGSASTVPLEVSTGLEVSQMQATYPAPSLGAPTSNFGTTIIYAVTYGNGLFVAGGETGQLRVSTDAITWSTATSNFGVTHINALTYGNDIYVAVGDAGQMRTSTKLSGATTWTTGTHTLGNTQILCAAYGGGKYIAGGVAAGNGQFTISTDAITWTSSYTGSPDTMYAITYGQGLFVAGGNNGLLVTSTDGVSWNYRTSGFGSSNTIYGLAYGGGTFVAVGGAASASVASTSTDGITWTTRTVNAGNKNLRGVAYCDGYFVVTVGGGSTSPLILSTDGITWTTGPNITNSMYGITYGQDKAVAVGGGGLIRTREFGLRALVQIAKI